MAVMLSVRIKEEQCSIIQFLWLESVSGAAVHQRLLAQYGNSVLLRWSVYERIEQLKNGCTSVTHEKGARCPSTATNEDNIEHVHDTVLLDKWLLMKQQIVCKVMVLPTKSSTKDKGFIKSVQDVSLSNSHKVAWTNTFGYLHRFDSECDAFVNKIIKVWNGNSHSFPEGKSSKSNHPQENSVLGLTRPITGTYQERGTAINSASYREMRTDRLKPAIRRKRRTLLSKGVLLLRDSARPHTAAHTDNHPPPPPTWNSSLV
jgi:hypothetical protein